MKTIQFQLACIVIILVIQMMVLMDIARGSELFYHDNLTIQWGNGPSIESVVTNKDQTQVIITMREISPYVYPEGGGPADTVWREIYGIVDGKIVFIEKVYADVEPPRNVPS